MDGKQWIPSIISLLMSFFPVYLSLLIFSQMFPLTFDEIYVGFNLLSFFLSTKKQSLLIFFEVIYIGSSNMFMFLATDGASQWECIQC